MKIIVPANGDALDSGVCASFGRAPWFLFHDSATGENSFLVNAAAENQGGAGIKAAQAVVDSGADALLTPRLGENAARVFSAAELRVYRSVGNGLQENLNAFLNGKLEELTQTHPGFHGHRAT